MVATYVSFLELEREKAVGRTYINQKLDTLQYGANMASGPSKDTLSYISVCLQWMTDGVKPDKKSP
jgi:hypothetical protein